MSLRFMYLADRTLGVLACWVLSWHRRTLGRLLVRKPAAEPQAILLIKLWGIGSILLSGPLQRALREAYPAARIYFLTFPQNRWAAEALGLADEVWTISGKGMGQALSDLSTFVRRCRRERIDLCLDLEFFSRLPAVLCYLSGAPRRIGYFARGLSRGELFTDRCTVNPYRHMTEIFCALVEAVGVRCEPDKPVAPRVKPEELAAVKAMLTEHDLPEGAVFVALSPNVSDLGAELRRWTPEGWAELADRLWAEHGLPSVFVGAPSDVEYVQGILARSASTTHTYSLAGRTTVGELAALISLASAVAACNSGPAHVSECLGIPTVALFGTETPTLYGTRGHEHRTVYKKPYCSPCLSVFNQKKVDFACDRRCMREISVNDVLEALTEVVRRPASDASTIPAYMD